MISFRHSGKLGDIIYSLATVKALGGGTFYVDATTEYPEKRPMGEQSAHMMADLLSTQEYISAAKLYEGEAVTFDLDRFRDKGFAVHAFNVARARIDAIGGLLCGGALLRELGRRLIPPIEVDLPQLHWEAVGLPGRVDVDVPWLTGIPRKRVADIVVSRTSRWAGKLDWRCLRPYASRAVFVGLAEEWRAFQDDCFVIEFYPVADLVDFARVVAGAKLYVGNQSFGLALADAMLTPRIAELSDVGPNRLPPRNAHRVLQADLVELCIDRDC